MQERELFQSLWRRFPLACALTVALALLALVLGVGAFAASVLLTLGFTAAFAGPAIDSLPADQRKPFLFTMGFGVLVGLAVLWAISHPGSGLIVVLGVLVVIVGLDVLTIVSGVRRSRHR
jgi:hypothetical protein